MAGAPYGRNCVGKYVFNSLVIQLVLYTIQHFFVSMRQVKYSLLSLFFSIFFLYAIFDFIKRELVISPPVSSPLRIVSFSRAKVEEGFWYDCGGKLVGGESPWWRNDHKETKVRFRCEGKTWGAYHLHRTPGNTGWRMKCYIPFYSKHFRNYKLPA